MLRFLDGGHDIFGNNVLFFPRNTWENILSAVEKDKEDAKTYETTFNEIISSTMVTGNFHQVSNKKPFFLFFRGGGVVAFVHVKNKNMAAMLKIKKMAAILT